MFSKLQRLTNAIVSLEERKDEDDDGGDGDELDPMDPSSYSDIPRFVILILINKRARFPII